jgi:hypothetical protein
VQRAERISDAEIAAELEVLQKQFARWILSLKEKGGTTTW